jgi:hypothetical protein
VFFIYRFTENKKRPSLNYSKDRRYTCGATLLGGIESALLFQDANTSLAVHAGFASDITGGFRRFLSAFRSPFAAPFPAPISPPEALLKGVRQLYFSIKSFNIKLLRCIVNDCFEDVKKEISNPHPCPSPAALFGPGTWVTLFGNSSRYIS